MLCGKYHLTQPALSCYIYSMKKKNTFKVVSIVVALLNIVGCGEGGGGSSPASSDPHLSAVMMSEAIRINGEMALTGMSIDIDKVTINFGNLPATTYGWTIGNAITVDEVKFGGLRESQVRHLISHELVHVLGNQNGVEGHKDHTISHVGGVPIKQLTGWWN